MNTRFILGLSAALALGACATTQAPNPALEAARTAVQTAEADPNVNRYAPLDLQAAQNELQVAQNAYNNRKPEEVGQPAYMATQDARLAQARAAAKADDARVAQGQSERDQIMLQARTREADNAKMAAANAKQEATTAKQEATTAMMQRDQANEEMAKVQSELDALKATQTPRGMVLTLGDVLFDTGRSELKPGATRKLDQLAQFLAEHPDRRVQIDGFTDSVGTDSYNEELSQQRADAVKAALITRGISPSRIGTEGYGKAYPVASNNDSGGRQMNRRVEVVIGDNNGTPISPRSGS
jgi:outer membrane protein OmpA-like peptidoglycan-associated protein